MQQQEQTKMAYSEIYDSSYDYTIYDMGFIFNVDEDDDSEELSNIKDSNLESSFH